MLVHRLQRWLNLNQKLDQRLARYLHKNISPTLVKIWAGTGDIETALNQCSSSFNVLVVTPIVPLP